MTTQEGSSFAVLLRVLHSEGLPAVLNRLRDRREEKNRLQHLKRLTVSDGRLPIEFEPPPVLNVSPMPPSPRRGGSQIQMLDRLAEERRLRTVALAYPKDGPWWLELWSGETACILRLDETANTADTIAQAARLAQTGIVHIENLHGLPLDLIHRLENQGLSTVLSVHDFTLFCRKPHLIEHVTGEFCGYSLDMGRCAACLRHVDPGQDRTQADYRRAGSESLRSAALVIYPSEFLQRQHRELFPGCRANRPEAVVAPATACEAASVKRSVEHPHVAFVGGVYAHKGGALIAPAMERVRAQNPEAVGFVYGNGDSALFRQLRRSKFIRVRGYYSQGGLPSKLARDEIAVAVLPSIWPETYSLVVDECLSAGVPVIAFDIGAVGDRLIEWGVGRLVSIRLGAGGLADAIAEHLSNDLDVPGNVIASLPRPARVARRHIELYDSLKTGAR